jgi:iron-sulfur cluster assembly accessory protein
MKDFFLDISAINRIKHMTNDPKGHSYKYLRILVESGGCSGFQYEYKFTNDKEENDLVINRDKVIVLIDPISIAFISGSKLEYIEELGAAYFQISNPNISAKCGCGNSFSI